MTAKRYTAWRFVHPDLDVPGGIAPSGIHDPENQAGLRLTPRGGIEMVSEDDSVRQSVLMLLSTRPGERLMRPEYGCNLQQLVFMPNDDTTAAVAIYQVRRSLLQWEPRIDILKLDARRDDTNPGILMIQLEYQVRTTHSVEQVHLAVDMAGGNP